MRDKPSVNRSETASLELISALTLRLLHEELSESYREAHSMEVGVNRKWYQRNRGFNPLERRIQKVVESLRVIRQLSTARER